MIEWDALNFTFYSIATTVLRLNPSSLHDRGKREQCLQYARQALWSMQACQKHLDTITHIATDFLFWCVPFLPGRFILTMETGLHCCTPSPHSSLYFAT